MYEYTNTLEWNGGGQRETRRDEREGENLISTTITRISTENCVLRVDRRATHGHH